MTSFKSCGTCELCCTYVTVETPAPKEHSDVDHLIWLLHHKHVAIFIDVDGWFVQFFTSCKHKNGHCTIYQDRPNICREYTHEECEQFGVEDPRVFLREEQELLEYLRMHLPEVWTQHEAMLQQRKQALQPAQGKEHS